MYELVPGPVITPGFGARTTCTSGDSRTEIRLPAPVIASLPMSRSTDSTSSCLARSCSISIVGGAINASPRDNSSREPCGVIQVHLSTSRGSGRGSHPSGARTQKNRVSKRTGAPNGVTHRPAGTSRSSCRRAPLSMHSSRNSSPSPASLRSTGRTPSPMMNPTSSNDSLSAQTKNDSATLSFSPDNSAAWARVRLEACSQRGSASAGDTAPPGKTVAPPMKRRLRGRTVTSISRPAGPSRRIARVAASLIGTSIAETLIRRTVVGPTMRSRALDPGSSGLARRAGPLWFRRAHRLQLKEDTWRSSFLPRNGPRP
jgi:hypothetical protein